MNRRVEHVFGAQHVGLDRLYREKFAGGNLLEGRRVKDVIHPVHRVADAVLVADVADVVFDLFVVVDVAHVVLLLFVARKDADFADIGLQKAFEHRVAERAGPSGNQQGFSSKQHMRFLLSVSGDAACPKLPPGRPVFCSVPPP